MAGAGLSELGTVVRRHDPDRFFCTLFAPVAMREVLFTLYAFNHELARAREVVREPFAALIRLQWWREVVEGTRTLSQVGRHEVAGAVRAAVERGALDAGELLGMIEGREMEAEPIETMAQFEAYVRATAGGVMVAAARALGMAEAEAVRGWGAAYGVAGVLRNAPGLARQGRSVLPVAGAEAPARQRAELVAQGLGWLADRVAVPRPARAATLPAVFARRDLAHGQEMRRFRDRLSATWAMLTT